MQTRMYDTGWSDEKRCQGCGEDEGSETHADLEVQRTIKKAEFTAFLSHLRGIVGPITAHVNNGGLWRGDMKCIGPTAKDADLWTLIWEEVPKVHQEGTLLEVEHVKAHRSKKKQEMTLSERFVTEGG